MAIREKATIRPRLVAELSFGCASLESLVQAIRSLDNRFTAGLCVGPEDDGEWVRELEAHRRDAFIHVLGKYIVGTEWSFTDVIQRLPSPAMYVLTGGFSVWGDKALLIHSAYCLHGIQAFRRAAVKGG